MGFQDDLKSASDSLRETTKGLALQRTFQQATEQAQQIRANEKNEFKQQQAFKSLAEILGQQLQTLGASPQEVATGIATFGPPSITAESQITQGSLQQASAKGDKEQIAAGQERVLRGQDLERRLGQVKQQNALDLKRADDEASLKISEMKLSQADKLQIAKERQQTQKEITGVQNVFNRDKTANQIRQSILANDNVTSLIRQNGVVGANAIKTLLASSIQPGNLTATEQEAFERVGSVIDKFRSDLEKGITGKLDANKKQALLQYTTLLGKAQRKQLTRKAKELSDQLASKKGSDPKTAFFTLFPDQAKEAVSMGLMNEGPDASADPADAFSSNLKIGE